MEHIKQNKRLVICVVAVCAAVVIAIAGMSYYNLQPGVRYQRAEDAYAAGNYEEAKAQFKLAGDILDAADMYTEARYQYGMNLLDHKQYGDARNTFKDLEDYKDAATLADAAILLMAQDQMADGDLLDAQNNLKRLSSDYTYDGVSVSDLSAQLSENQQWVDITGDLKVNSGAVTTDCLYKRDNHSMGEWTLAADTLDISMNVKCRIGDDGKVTIVIYGYLPYFTEWSTLSALVDFDLQEIDVTKELNASDIGKSISIDDNTTFTVLEDGIRFHYYKKETNKDTIFDYEYETDMTYKR